MMLSVLDNKISILLLIDAYDYNRRLKRMGCY